MSSIELTIILGLIVLVIVFVVDYWFILKPKYNILTDKKVQKKKKNNDKVVIGELELMKVKHKINLENNQLKYVIVNIAFINAFIISFTSVVIMLTPLDLIWQLLIGFVLLFGLIYAIYEIYGRYLERRSKR